MLGLSVGKDELSPVERNCRSQVPAEGRTSSQGRQDPLGCAGIKGWDLWTPGKLA